MRFTLFIGLIIFSFLAKSQQVVSKINTFNFDLRDLNVGVENNGQGLGGAMTSTVSSTLMYSVNGTDNIISIPNYSYKDLFPIHFVRKNNAWKIDSLYKDISIVGRNYSMIDTLGTFAYADHGREFGPRSSWPYGHIWKVSNVKGKLVWTQVSKIKSFYHSVGTGDLNNDGQIDVIGLHMGTYNKWTGFTNLHPFKNNQDGTFSEWYDIMTDLNFPENIRYSAGAVFVKDLYGDKYPEVVRGTYGQGGDLERHSLTFYKFDQVEKIYKYDKKALDLGVFKNDPTIGATSIKSIDFNKDGFLDLAVAFEGNLNGIQLWKNDGKGNFSSDQYFGFEGGKYGDTTGYSFREFEVGDLDNDGWEDIVLHPTDYNNRFRINPKPAPSEKTKGEGIRLNTSIWRNEKGKFKFLEQNISFLGIYPGSMKGFFINGDLRYIGFENTEFASSTTALNCFKLHDITLHFCNNLIKPTFNLSKYSFCSGDSLKLSITNINKGDSMKWYFDTKSDVSNVSTKIFKESAKVYVVRTDSYGCNVNSDTISLVKISLPTPTITREGNTTLISSTPTGNQWYLDGSIIKGEVGQKINATVNGLYSVKYTDANGCLSENSASLYGLITATGLSDKKVIISPNPFEQSIKIEFPVDFGPMVSAKIHDVKGIVVWEKESVRDSEIVDLSSLSVGNYVLNLTSQTNGQVKVVKISKQVR